VAAQLEESQEGLSSMELVDSYSHFAQELSLEQIFRYDLRFCKIVELRKLSEEHK
jgi:hypothetical protein